jgi:hypothetical protein
MKPYSKQRPYDRLVLARDARLLMQPEDGIAAEWRGE